MWRLHVDWLLDVNRWLDISDSVVVVVRVSGLNNDSGVVLWLLRVSGITRIVGITGIVAHCVAAVEDD